MLLNMKCSLRTLSFQTLNTVDTKKRAHFVILSLYTNPKWARPVTEQTNGGISARITLSPLYNSSTLSTSVTYKIVKIVAIYLDYQQTKNKLKNLFSVNNREAYKNVT